MAELIPACKRFNGTGTGQRSFYMLHRSCLLQPQSILEEADMEGFNKQKLKHAGHTKCTEL